jgi:hypothetical protein
LTAFADIAKIFLCKKHTLIREIRTKMDKPEMRMEGCDVVYIFAE